MPAPNAIKAIETEYRGTIYRSRTEAERTTSRAAASCVAARYVVRNANETIVRRLCGCWTCSAE